MANVNTYRERQEVTTSLITAAQAVCNNPTKPNLKRLKEVTDAASLLLGRGRGRPATPRELSPA